MYVDVLRPITSNDNAILTIASDYEANIYSLGFFTKSIQFGCFKLRSTNIGIFLNKISSDGCYLWSKKICDLSTQGSITNFSMAVTNNVFIDCQLSAGKFMFPDGKLFDPPQTVVSSFVSEITPDGKPLYALSYRAQFGVSMSADYQGNAFIVGSYDTNTHPNLKNLVDSGDIVSTYVSKFNKNGFTWATNATTSSIKKCEEKCEIVPKVSPTSILHLNNSNLITGGYTGKVYFDNIRLESDYEFDNAFMATIDDNGNWMKVIGFDSPNKNLIYQCTKGCENIFITGSFEKTLRIGNGIINSNELRGSNYIAMFSSDLTLEWIQLFTSSQLLPRTCNSTVYLTTRRDGTSFIYGFYLGHLKLGHTTLYAKEVSSYLAQVNPDGSFPWAIDISGLDCTLEVGQEVLDHTKKEVIVTGVGEKVKLLGQSYASKTPTSFLIKINTY